MERGVPKGLSMGDMADFTNGGGEWMAYVTRPFRRVDYSRWPSKPKSIPLVDMSDSHIENAINYSRKAGNAGWVSALQKEQERRSNA